MWKMKNLYKKAGALFLASALVAGTVSPFSVYAEGETKKEETTVQTAVQSEAEEGVTEEKKETATKTGYDVTKPVIEEVIFEQEGKTLNPGDTVRIAIRAYDADSGIKSIGAELRFSKPNTQGGYDHVFSFVKKDGENLYEATYELPKDTGFTEGRIHSIKVEDNAGNELYEREKSYSFNIAGVEASVLKVNDFQLEGNHQTLKVDDTVTCSFSVTGEPEGIDLSTKTFEVEFERQDGNDSRSYYASYNEATKRFEATFVIDSYMGAYRWNFKSITHDWNGIDQEQDVASVRDCWFEVQEYVAQGDTVAPQITSFEMSHNGQVVKPGDTVTITVKATDDKGIDTDYAYVNMRAAVQDIANNTQTVYLTYDKAKDAFVGEFLITENTYPCEWYCDYLHVRDQSGNGADMNLEDDANNPLYYVLVKNGDSFVNPTLEIDFDMTYMLDNGEWFSQKLLQPVKMERRSTLKDYGVKLPIPEVSYPGVKFVGWVDSHGQPFTEDTEIISDTYVSLHAKYDRPVISFEFWYHNTEGKAVRELKTKVFPVDVTPKEVEEWVKAQPAPKDMSKDVVFKGWDYDYDFEYLSQLSWQIHVEAEYEEKLISVTYEYLNNKNEWAEVEKAISVAKNSTAEELEAEFTKFRPADAADGVTFDRWELRREDGLYPESPSGYMIFEAVYKDAKTVSLDKFYYDKTGRYTKETVCKVVPRDATYEDVEKLVKNEPKPNVYKDLRFTGWNYYGYGTGVVGEEHLNTSVIAEYENCMIGYYVYDNVYDFYNAQSIYGQVDIEEKAFTFQVVEKGDVITLPSQVGQYKNLVYESGDLYGGAKYTADYNRNFIILDTKTVVEPEKPTDPEKPSEPQKPTDPEKPSEPQKPVKPQKPAVELPKEVVTEQVDKLNKGESVQIDMDKATVVPKEILEAAKGKDVTVKLNMGGYTWTINGKDIKANTLKDINLEVTVNSNAIPSKTVQALAGKNPTCQLSLTHNGPFGFKADLTVNVGAKYNGKFGNLYYYDSDGKMVYRNSGKIDKNGNVTVSFDHASDYVIVMSDKKMSQSDVPAKLTPNNQGGNETVKTGDTAPIFGFVLLAVVSMTAIVLVMRRKKVR